MAMALKRRAWQPTESIFYGEIILPRVCALTKFLLSPITWRPLPPAAPTTLAR